MPDTRYRTIAMLATLGSVLIFTPAIAQSYDTPSHRASVGRSPAGTALPERIDARPSSQRESARRPQRQVMQDSVPVRNWRQDRPQQLNQRTSSPSGTTVIAPRDRPARELRQERSDYRQQRRDQRTQTRQEWQDRPAWQNRGDRQDRRDWQNQRDWQDRREPRSQWGNNYRNNDHRYGTTNRWRQDRRYDWQRYRQQNRHIYRPGRYYPPHRDYRYRRPFIGITIGSSFLHPRYALNDPWRYRLPPVSGAYRWIRYYDDVLLVNAYNGRVVDVVNDFFW
ncbi:RcnB family protein [Croceicoccus sp. F390]|uniref:RcnB family protein n=1 Tax=Croceicoccus esteveae TaxID=3075597 RepID=A0ABU2ZDP2_9SPHN|nr:RcnB family protein [Croceicoccus sp. F390]MDT0574723.1 RcnB family protein [Croceicoccus sp. F390]